MVGGHKDYTVLNHNRQTNDVIVCLTFLSLWVATFVHEAMNVLISLDILVQSNIDSHSFFLMKKKNWTELPRHE